MPAMKSLVLIVAIIIAELNVECYGQPAADPYHEDQGRGSPDEHQLLEDASASMKDLQGSFLEEERMQNNSEPQMYDDICDGQEKPKCIKEEGYCIEKGTHCPGKLAPRLCRGANCDCCIPLDILHQPDCPEEEGFFLHPASNQCFKLFSNLNVSWDEAYYLCQDNGLTLPHPYQATKLRKYIVQRYGNVGHLWMNARGNDTYMLWEDNWVVITSDNPLWAPGQPVGVTYDDCLEMNADEIDWAWYPDQPYFSDLCMDSHPYTLCELDIKYPVIADPSGVVGYRLL